MAGTCEKGAHETLTNKINNLAYILLDKFDGLRHGGGDDVGVGPGLGGQLGLLISSHGLESVDLTVELHH